MKNCPTSNMNRSQLWGFEVSHIVCSLGILAGTNVLLNVFGAPLFLSWIFGLGALAILRFISHGQKNGHLEMLARFTIEPRVYLGHRQRAVEKASFK
ncbi:MAG: hypothetical protein A4S09_15165 [Proteobacteria bacterium SG_bin7]|nr:MAG: hypothetical protein A4S09_15165 [Proteobacteria bacterium SG_bin7]